ncbi:hypothetical protein LTS17_006875 [Exophiala oligosperma]
MSALVAYESSSDEDEVADQDAGRDQVATTTIAKGHHDQNGDIKFFVKPSEPSPDITAPTASVDSVAPMLTFASHPMASLPPSPPGSPDPVLEVKFKKFLDLKTKGMHFNEDLASKSAFRNPGLLATMMVRIGLDEEDQYRTSLPHQVWNPTGFPKSAYKEELLRAQQTLRDQDLAAKKSLSAQGKRTIEFMPGGRSGDSSRDSTPGMPNKRKRP